MLGTERLPVYFLFFRMDLRALLDTVVAPIVISLLLINYSMHLFDVNFERWRAKAVEHNLAGLVF